MSYQFIDESATILKVIVDGDELLFKKVYCSTAVDGDYFILNTHEYESNIYRQEFKLLYTDCTNPSEATAVALQTEVDAIINSYAGGGTGSSPLISKGDIYTRNATADTRLPIGLDTQVLIADSSATTGLKWGSNTAATPLGYYGAWQDNVTQTAVASNVGYAMIFRTIDVTPNGISVVTNGTNLTRITFANTGIYNIQFSSQFQNTDNAEHDVTIWLRLNGTDVAGSAGFVQVPKRKSAGAGNEGHVVVSWNYLLNVVAGQYYELIWSTNNHTYVTMQFYAGGSPPPSSASVILTVTQQSGIMAGTGVTAINTLTGAAQTLVTNGSGTDFNIASTGTTHTFNLPTASATNRGALTSSDYTTFNNKLTSFFQFRKAGRWYTNALFPPANAAFTNQLAIRYVPFFIDNDVTITRMGINVVSIAPATSTCRLGIYTNDPTTTQPLTRIYGTGTLAIDSTGAKSEPGLSVALTKGLYWMAYVSNANSGTITGIGTGAIFDVKGQANIGAVGFAGFNQTFTYGALPATATPGTEVNSGGTICIFYYY